MRKITFQRKKQLTAAVLDVRVLLDNADYKVLRKGEAFTFDLDDNCHTLQAICAIPYGNSLSNIVDIPAGDSPLFFRLQAKLHMFASASWELSAVAQPAKA